MGRISSGVGLVSGLKYQEIIDSLVALDKRPVDLLTAEITRRKAQQTVFTGLSASMLSLSLGVSKLGQASVLSARQATSSNSALVQATASATAVVGSYSFRPVRQAQTQRFNSAGFADATTQAVGAGTISIKRGGFVTSETLLETLNGGNGVSRGKIRIIDRGGNSTIVDLGGAQTIDDVLTAINENGVVAVSASISGDALVLTDETGLTTVNLSVQEVAGGSTAADLGLAGSVAASQKVGTDIVSLGATLKLSHLNDGLGVRRHGTLPDLRITLKDGATIDVDLSDAKTIADVLEAINTDSENTGDLAASIAGDGDKLVLTDTSGGGGTLTVTELNGSKAARDLGILGSDQAGGILTGRGIFAGLNSVLLKNLNGGQGIATPGHVQLTDRSGATATINLTNARSLSEVVDAINGAGLGIRAAVNVPGHGITLDDTTGSTTSNLIVADTGGGTTAADLNIDANVAANTVASGDLHRAYINENTSLASLNGGAGISGGQFRISDRNGSSTVINLAGNSYKTIGDLLLSINAGSADIEATINSTGDGILLTDLSIGTGTFTVADIGTGKAAADLRLVGSGGSTIDGAFVHEITIDADDTLNDVVTKIGESGVPLTASVFNTGGATGAKLLLSAKQGGAAGRLLIDSGTTNLGLMQSQAGHDAVVQLNGGNGAAPIVFTSSTNTFQSIVAGVSLTIGGVSNSPVTVTVEQSADALATSVNSFVASFNSLVDTLKKQTSFDSTTATASLLQGDRTAVGLQQSLLGLVSRTYGSGTNSIRNFTQIGISLTGGVLSFDESVLRAKLAENPDAVKDFFGATSVGASSAMGKVVQSYSDASTGILFNRIDALDNQQQTLTARIDRLNAAIESKKTRMSLQFLVLEKTLAQLQSQQTSLNSLANLISFNSNSSSNSSGSSNS